MKYYLYVDESESGSLEAAWVLYEVYSSKEAAEQNENRLYFNGVKATKIECK